MPTPSKSSAVSAVSAAPAPLAGERVIQYYDLPGGDVVATVAEAVAALHRDGLLDRHGAWFIVPDQLAIRQLSEAMRERLPRDFVRACQFHTLQTLAATCPLPHPVMSPARQQAQLYTELHRRRLRVDERLLWPLAAQLADQFRELTLSGVSRVPESLEDFTAIIAASGAARDNELLTLEAALIHGLWRAYVDERTAVDATTLYTLQLGELARRPGPPLVTLGLLGLRPVEEDFLAEAARHRSVHCLRPLARADEPLALALGAAWPQCELLPHDGAGEPPPLRERARQLRRRVAQNPFPGRLACLAEPTLEAHAAAVTRQIRAWYDAGCRQIALLVYDRIAARRVRALLDHEALPVEDETGWTLSTSVAGVAVSVLVDAALEAFTGPCLLHLLATGYVLDDWAPERRAEAATRLGRRLRTVTGRFPLDQLRRLALCDGDDDVAELLGTLERTAECFSRHSNTLPGWLDALGEAMACVGMTPALSADSAAGARLLALLEARRAELADSHAHCDLRTFRQWLEQQLECDKYRDSTPAPIIFTYAQAAQMRRFDAVIVVGADIDHLPSPYPESPLFGDEACHLLGLPSREDYWGEQLAMLVRVLAHTPRIVFSWQTQRQGQPVLPSRWVDYLDILSQCAWDAPLPAAATAPPPPAAGDALTTRPAAVLPDTLLPGRITPEAYATLMTCPYQFFARHILGLAPLDEVGRALSKRDYGQIMHKVLGMFSREHRSLRGKDRARLEARLMELAAAEFDQHPPDADPCGAWRRHFAAMVPRFLDWWQAREEAGWALAGINQPLAAHVPLGGGTGVSLQARVDRVERRPAGGDGAWEYALIDFRASAGDRLRKSVAAPGEHVALPTLVALSTDRVGEAFYLGLDGADVAAAPLKDASPEQGRRAVTHLAQLMGALRDHAPLPANGRTSDCDYCDMRGLCRKDHWQAAESATPGDTHAE